MRHAVRAQPKMILRGHHTMCPTFPQPVYMGTVLYNVSYKPLNVATFNITRSGQPQRKSNPTSSPLIRDKQELYCTVADLGVSLIRGLTHPKPPQRLFDCQYEHSYGPAFSRTLNPPPLLKNSWIRPCFMPVEHFRMFPLHGCIPLKTADTVKLPLFHPSVSIYHSRPVSPPTTVYFDGHPGWMLLSERSFFHVDSLFEALNPCQGSYYPDRTSSSTRGLFLLSVSKEIPA